MSRHHFPGILRNLPAFEGPFDAHRLDANGCEVLFASYPAGTMIDSHTHPTRNVGVVTEGAIFLTTAGVERRYGVGEWYSLQPDEAHTARFEEDTAEIEFWFDV